MGKHNPPTIPPPYKTIFAKRLAKEYPHRRDVNSSNPMDVHNQQTSDNQASVVHDPSFQAHQTANTYSRNQVSAMQQFLKKQGYNLATDGVLGPQTRSAMQDWQSGVGKRNPQEWSSKNAPSANTPDSPNDRAGTQGVGDGNTNAPGRKPQGAGGAGAFHGIPIPFAGNENPNVWNALKTIDPKLADSLAGSQFDPQIAEMKLAQGRQTRDSAQAMHDIGNWFSQVQQSLGAAQKNDASAANDAVAGTGAATAGILSSLGGDANLGAGMIANAGAAQSAEQAAMGQAESQYQNDMSPILAQAQAGASQNQRNTDTKNAQDLAMQLASLMGQRGQAKDNYLMQILQDNNGINAQKIQGQQSTDQYNNSLDQQRFQNLMSNEELRQAAKMNDAQAGYYSASTKAAGQGGFIPWNKLNAGQKQGLVNNALYNVVDGNGALLPQYAKNPKAAWIAARQYLRGQGFNSAFKNSASSMGNYQNITDLLAPLISRAQGMYQQKVSLGQ